LKICSVEGCGNKHKGKGYCEKHLRRFNKYGNPLDGKPFKILKNIDICSIEGCEGKHKGYGYCNTHYQRFKKHGDPFAEVPILINNYDEICSIEGCDNKHVAKGYCTGHYQRFKKHGDPLIFGKSLSKRNFDNNGICSIEGCNGKYKANGLCSKHYKRFLDNGNPLVSQRNYEHEGKCSVEKCNKKYYQHGLCRNHYYRSDFKKADTQKRRSWKKNAPLNDLTTFDWKKSLIHFGDKCAYCGKKSNKTLHQEHIIPLSKGGSNTITNVIPACESCNLSKNDSLLEDWYPKRFFYSKERELKIFEWMGYKVGKNNLQVTLF
jgi:5-methylcytosine-specific restriction endonuclease McrA